MSRLLTILVIVLIAAWAWTHLTSVHHAQGPVPATAWGDAIRKQEVLSARQQPVTPGSIGTTPYTFVYFSAGWCPPCHRFTPQLVSFYRAEQPRHRCALIMVDEDPSPEEEQRYIDEFDMPWLFARWQGALWHRLHDAYANRGIPQLVLLNRDGVVLADSFDGTTYVGPEHVLDAYRELVH